MRTTAAVGALILLTTAMGQSETTQFDVNGFCLQVDAPEELYNVYRYTRSSGIAPTFNIDLGAYSSADDNVGNTAKGDGQPFIMTMSVMKSSNNPEALARLNNNLRSATEVCETENYDFDLTRIIDNGSPQCGGHFRQRFYVGDHGNPEFGTVRIQCNESSRYNCRISENIEGNWRMRGSIPEEYLPQWQDVRARMGDFFNQYLSDC